ncbi:hypothetical protein QJU43_06075 [Pasteurella atlantica]|uniref:Uncharacterized protein n=2 Tax=Pasteurellaceae TaxID=712 RepID=A0ACC6HK56_9PAST|nr:hypothetical protein [Pasteurella atlantica]MDP8033775.1 hypothetical protein [Pasteurella atlantica]MDP8035710.1 hypothetical protein [Pasteurella atlantica]MDP8037609.1 hypothetical protein [Pasteurella atlantica]MDP8048010.1 hypothetical protein [Pasteurella atlantica]MDP8049965.1 hypothetical protein [Pasteurella atlantica]
MLKKYCFIFVILFITACSSSFKVIDLPKQAQDSRLFKIEQQDNKNNIIRSSLLSIQFENEQWRWVQVDPLGSPIARVLLSKQGWQNDGFIMPNSQAQQLFYAIATGLNPNQPLLNFSQIQRTSSGQIYWIKNKKVWKISQKKHILYITLADNSYWKVEEINRG